MEQVVNNFISGSQVRGAGSGGGDGTRSRAESQLRVGTCVAAPDERDAPTPAR